MARGESHGAIAQGLITVAPLGRETGAVWRKRLQELARLPDSPNPPLFSPLFFAVAASIEAISPTLMSQDGTRIRKNLSELRRVLGTPGVTCTVPAGMEAEALGVDFDLDNWPPRPIARAMGDWPEEFDASLLSSDRRLGATIIAVTQLRADVSQPLIAAALTGPFTLLQELRAAGYTHDDELGFDFVAQALALLVRRLAETGVDLMQFCESSEPPGECTAQWQGALSTIAKVARFHRAPPLLSIAGTGALKWPASMIPCPGPDQDTPPAGRALGGALGQEPQRWRAELESFSERRVITTQADAATGMGIGELRPLISAMLGE